MKWLCLFLVLMLFPMMYAQSINDLLSNPEAFDNQLVTVRGEVLGILKRGNKAWINIQENSYAIGVWCEVWMLENLKVVADYQHLGDVVEITGVFHKACTEHGGDPDIHAENLIVVERGYRIQREINWWLMAVSVFLLILSIYLLLRLRGHEEKRALPYWY
jgi:hypothetical protein